MVYITKTLPQIIYILIGFNNINFLHKKFHWTSRYHNWLNLRDFSRCHYLLQIKKRKLRKYAENPRQPWQLFEASGPQSHLFGKKSKKTVFIDGLGEFMYRISGLYPFFAWQGGVTHRHTRIKATRCETLRPVLTDNSKNTHTKVSPYDFLHFLPLFNAWKRSILIYRNEMEYEIFKWAPKSDQLSSNH